MVNNSLREPLSRSADRLGIHMPEPDPEVDPDNPYRMAERHVREQFDRRQGRFARPGMGLSNINAPRFVDEQSGFGRRRRR